MSSIQHNSLTFLLLERTEIPKTRVTRRRVAYVDVTTPRDVPAST